jgi:putative ATP-dependent endonuclease of the OLD family
MKLSKIEVENYRILRDFKMSVEDVLSLVVGKNNCGKTALLSVLEKFLSGDQKRSNFSLDDINIECQRSILDLVLSGQQIPENSNYGISLQLEIKYDENDSFANISDIMLDLDPEARTIVLAFGYGIKSLKLIELRDDFQKYCHEREQLREQNNKPDADSENRDEPTNGIIQQELIRFIKAHIWQYFELTKKSVDPANADNYVDIIKEKLSLEKIINFKSIKAKRDVASQDDPSGRSDKTLSKMSARYYDRLAGPVDEPDSVKRLKEHLRDTDSELDTIYSLIFESVIDQVRTFGGVLSGEAEIKVISSLAGKSILSNNTTVMYEHDHHDLPEDYNGLGYMNLIAMIFEIEVLVSEFRNENKTESAPADLNILFIEEPEAHTHPQMQYAFIRNIKKMLKQASLGEDGNVMFGLQTLVTTHSSHIVAESDFDDIKYFYRASTSKNSVHAKNLSDLRSAYNLTPNHFEFLRQYLTLSRAELFFADKAILIEGDTERLLLPAMMKKLDDVEDPQNDTLPLLSQNISIVEVGSYAHIFDRLIDFLGIKTLIITDIDAVRKVPAEANGQPKLSKDGTPILVLKACEVKDGTNSSNSTIKYFLNQASDVETATDPENSEAANVQQNSATLLAPKSADVVGEEDESDVESSTDLHTLLDLLFENKTFSLKDGKWKFDKDGVLRITFQTKDVNGYYARSFEDAFISLNHEFVRTKSKQFRGLKNRKILEAAVPDPFKIADNCIDKKTSFALDILYHSEVNFANWHSPEYIIEGLKWIRA